MEKRIELSRLKISHMRTGADSSKRVGSLSSTKKYWKLARQEQEGCQQRSSLVNSSPTRAKVFLDKKVVHRTGFRLEKGG